MREVDLALDALRREVLEDLQPYDLHVLLFREVDIEELVPELFAERARDLAGERRKGDRGFDGQAKSRPVTRGPSADRRAPPGVADRAATDTRSRAHHDKPTRGAARPG